MLDKVFNGQLPLFQLSISVLLIVSYFVVRWMLYRLFFKIARRKKVPKIRAEQIVKYFKVVLGFVILILLMMVWGFDYKGLLVFASSILAVIGVALIAQWSILSNVTAGVIVFFSFPAKIGDDIEIVDGANSVKGKIIEINMFQLVLLDEKGQQVSYPNSLILQKPVIKQQVEKSDVKPDSKTNRMMDRLSLKK